MELVGPPGKAAAFAQGGYLEPFVLLEPPAENPGCSCVVAHIQLRNVFLIFSCFTAVAKVWTPTRLEALEPPGPPLDPPGPPGCLLDSLDALEPCLHPS